LAFGGSFKIGYAAAVSMVLLLIVCVITVLQNMMVSDEVDSATD